MLARLGLALVLVLAVALGVLYLLGSGALGSRWENGEPTRHARTAASVKARGAAQQHAARDAGVTKPDQILFGDLHVHTTFSPDAFMAALPLVGGDGAHPVSDACDFARWCSALDFWSINDHDVGQTPWKWKQTIQGIRDCNAVSEDAADPDTVAYLGWEWTQIGTTPENHYGHKNVVVRGLDDGDIPPRPITVRLPGVNDEGGGGLPGPLVMGLFALSNLHSDTLDSLKFMREMADVPACPEGVAERELPDDCREFAATPADLFAKLDEWGFDSMVIPHGTTWGLYTPMGSAWDKQLVGAMHDPARQKLIEVYSGHGNSEEYRSWREVVIDANGHKSCPGPRSDYLPSCWRAGEIIRERCGKAGKDDDECEERAAQAVGTPVYRVALDAEFPRRILRVAKSRDVVLCVRDPRFGLVFRRFLGQLGATPEVLARVHVATARQLRTTLREAGEDPLVLMLPLAERDGAGRAPIGASPVLAHWRLADGTLERLRAAIAFDIARRRQGHA
jgi:hypothetical protein